MTTARQQDGYGSIGFVPVLRRWWWLLVLAAAIAGICAYLITRSTTPGYESRTQLLVGPVNTDTDTIRAAGQLALTYAALAKSAQVVDSTIQELALPITPSELKDKTTVTADADTRVLTIRVETDNPALSQSIANGLAENLQTLTSSGAATRPEGTLTFIEQATPGENVAASDAFVIALAALAGFIGMLVIVLVIEYFRGTVRSEEELGDLTGAPVLGAVATGRPGGSNRPLLVEASPGSPAASAYRVVAAEIEYSRAEGQGDLRTVLVLGTQREEGSGELALNLAASFARGGRRILLIDADDASGEVSRMIGLNGAQPEVALASIAGRGLGALRRFRSSSTPSLEVVPRGAFGTIDAIEPKQIDDLVARLLEEYEVLVIAGAPLFDSSSSLTWARECDATILSAMRDRTRRERIGDAVDSLRIVNARLAGIVLTQSRALDRLRRRNGRRLKRGQGGAWQQVGDELVESNDGTTRQPAGSVQTNGPQPVREQELRTLSNPHDR